MRHLKTFLIFSLILILLMGCGNPMDTATNAGNTQPEDQEDTSPPPDDPSSPEEPPSPTHSLKQ